MRLLIIDDEPWILESIQSAFANDQVQACRTATEGIQRFVQHTPDVVLCDIRLPDLSGLEAFDRLHQIDPRVPIILMTGHGTSNTAIEAMRRGAFEYVLKPLDPDHLIPIVENAAEISRMTRVRTAVPSANLGSVGEGQSGDLLIGNCPAMQEVYRAIGKVAKQDVTVLILGESGTGKEVVARAIYQYGSRPEGRFLAINCAAIPENLLESELFGHEKGAFTGAETKRIGKFELCDQGTLFLDEIGDMTPLMQTKILRVLQDQSFERVGGNQTIQTHARLIAATNRNLEEAIANKMFRSDLYYRLNVFSIRLPPLRERGDDITLLANYFAQRSAKEMGKPFDGFTKEALHVLQAYSWPGNVRELQSVIKRALIQATSSTILPKFLPHLSDVAQTLSHHQSTERDHLGSYQRSVSPQSLDFASLTRQQLEAGSEAIHRELLAIAESQILHEVLRYTGGNLTQAAKRLGITRVTLRSRLEALGISVDRTTSVTQRNG